MTMNKTMIVLALLFAGCAANDGLDDVADQTSAVDETPTPEDDLSALRVCLDTCEHIESKCEKRCTGAEDWCVAGCDGDRDICRGTCDDIWGHHGGVLDVQSTGPVDHACKTAYSWCLGIAKRIRQQGDCSHNPQAAGYSCEEWAQQQEASCLVDLFECVLQ
jgi:hypothetical protein